MGVLFLTIDVPVKILGISLNITNQVVHINIMLLPDIVTVNASVWRKLTS